MKKTIGLLLGLLLVCLCACALADVAINETNFPDAGFREYVKEKFDTDNNESLDDKEIKAADIIDVKFGCEYTISSLKGIEYFSAMELLCCDDSQLTELDVSKNTAMIELRCCNNRLTKLDISKNTALFNLWCDGNQLTKLDVSKNTRLDILSCRNNHLTELYIGNNTALECLECNNNQLTKLDVSKNTKLLELYCASNQLTSLDISRNTGLGRLECSHNQLTSLDISRNTGLGELECSHNQLTSLDISRNTSLYLLECQSNKLKKLDISMNPCLIGLVKNTKPVETEGALYWSHENYANSLRVDRDVEIITDEPENPDIIDQTVKKITVISNGHGSAKANKSEGKTGETVTLSAKPDKGYVLDHWKVESGGVTIKNNAFTIGTSDVKIRAYFSAKYTVTVTTDGHGTAVADPASGPKGTQVVLTATPNKGYKFKKWKVVSGGVSIKDNKFKIGSANVKIQALFEKKPSAKKEYYFKSINNLSIDAFNIFSNILSDGNGGKFWGLVEVDGESYFKFETANEVIYILRDAFTKVSKGYNKSQLDSCNKNIGKKVLFDSGCKQYILAYSSDRYALKTESGVKWNITKLEVSGMYDTSGFTFKVKKVDEFQFVYIKKRATKTIKGELRKGGNHAFQVKPIISFEIKKVGKDVGSFATCMVQGKGRIPKKVNITSLIKIGTTIEKLSKGLTKFNLGNLSTLFSLAEDVDTLKKGEKVSYVGDKHTLTFSYKDKKTGKTKKKYTMKIKFESPSRIETIGDYFQASIGTTKVISRKPYPTLSFSLAISFK